MRIEVENLTRTFNRVNVVDGVSFRIDPGDLAGYLGPNGAGKSTTVRMLTGLLEPSAGAIRCDGTTIDKDLPAYRARIGYVPEETHLYSYLTGEEYLLMAGRLQGLPSRMVMDKLHRMADLLCLREVDLYLPLGNYSKGMKQKVLIIAALMHRPETLILDEPFSGLDVTVTAILRAFLNRFCANGGSVLFSSHILEVVERLCRRVIILHRGKIVADSTMAELKAIRREDTVEEVFSRLVEQVDSEKIAGEILACSVA
ncbi:MAG: ABC transporter ATP-binding protein [Acidobacteriota bacterium]|jgi:ABC-2 type transport system ATP-binding protein|nr:ABC transporter ATP-binding protein [Acidobacteriota bacterium]